jgi:flagellar hook-basal body complex protein FliE
MSAFELPPIVPQLRARSGVPLEPPLVGETAAPLDGERVGGDGHGHAFGGVLADALAKVDALQQRVGDQVQALASGEPVALHDIMMSMGKSEVAFNLMLEVRNKLVDAWEKLSRSVV